MGEGEGRGSVDRDKEDHSGLWKTSRFDDEDFWFLRPDADTVEAVEDMNTLSSQLGVAEDQQAIININNLVVKIESGVGNNTIPLLLLESTFNCDVRNWSGPRMTAIGSMNLVMAYYNSKLALWEPVIEPVTQVRLEYSPERSRENHEFFCRLNRTVLAS